MSDILMVATMSGNREIPMVNCEYIGFAAEFFDGFKQASTRAASAAEEIRGADYLRICSHRSLPSWAKQCRLNEVTRWFFNDAALSRVLNVAVDELVEAIEEITCLLNGCQRRS